MNWNGGPPRWLQITSACIAVGFGALIIITEITGAHRPTTAVISLGIYLILIPIVGVAPWSAFRK